MKLCKFCGKNFRDIINLNRHLERKNLCVDIKIIHEKYLSDNVNINVDGDNININNINIHNHIIDH